MKLYWEHILQNKYNYLLMTQIIILIFYPVLQTYEMKFPFVNLLLLVAITPALWVGLSRKLFLAVITVGTVAFFLNVLVRVKHVDFTEKGIMTLLILYAVFYFLAISTLLKRISSNTVVTADTIKGGISIYILLGLFWALIYLIVLTYDKSAFTNLKEGNEGFDCFYYSFTTLTTLGYGDITPVARYARILAIMEAITGPVYLAIFVAQIIGLNIAQKLKK